MCCPLYQRVLQCVQPMVYPLFACTLCVWVVVCVCWFCVGVCGWICAYVRPRRHGSHNCGHHHMHTHAHTHTNAGGWCKRQKCIHICARMQAGPRTHAREKIERHTLNFNWTYILSREKRRHVQYSFCGRREIMLYILRDRLIYMY